MKMDQIRQNLDDTIQLEINSIEIRYLYYKKLLLEIVDILSLLDSELLPQESIKEAWEDMISTIIHFRYNNDHDQLSFYDNLLSIKQELIDHDWEQGFICYKIKTGILGFITNNIILKRNTY